MTPEARSAIENGIWLCASCATLIDRDPEAYPPSLLHRWRHEAEALARRAHGRKPAGDSDSIDTLVAAMTGHSPRLTTSSISNVHIATGRLLQALDSRFNVVTEYAGGITHVHLNPKEPVQMRITVDSQSIDKWSGAFDALLRNAEETSLPMQGVSFSGSPLLESLTARPDASDAQLTISPIGRPAVIKLSTGISSVKLDDIDGHVFAGQDMLRFEGKKYDSLLTFRLALPREGDSITKPKFDVHFDISRWQGKPLKNVKFLKKLDDLVLALHDANSFRVHLEVEGNTVVEVSRPNSRDTKPFDSVATCIHYTHCAQIVTAFLGVELNVKLDCSFTAAEHAALTHAAEVIQGILVFGAAALLSPLEVTLLVSNAADIEQMLQTSETRIFKISKPSERVRIFEQEFDLPPLGKF